MHVLKRQRDLSCIADSQAMFVGLSVPSHVEQSKAQVAKPLPRPFSPGSPPNQNLSPALKLQITIQMIMPRSNLKRTIMITM